MLLKTESNYLSKVKLSSRNLLFSSHSLKYSWDIFAHGTLFSLGVLLPQASLIIFSSMFQISPIYKYWEVSEFSPCCYCCLVAKSCLTHCNPMNCKGSSVRGISQARILEWVIISFFRGSSRPKDWTHVSCLVGRFFTTEPPGKPSVLRLTHFFIYPNSLVHLIQSPDLKCPILFPVLTFPLILVLYIQPLSISIWMSNRYLNTKSNCCFPIFYFFLHLSKLSPILQVFKPKNFNYSWLHFLICYVHLSKNSIGSTLKNTRNLITSYHLCQHYLFLHYCCSYLTNLPTCTLALCNLLFTDNSDILDH